MGVDLPAAVVFDFDGLILDTELPEYVTVREVFEAHGVPLPLERWVGIVGRADHPHWIDWLEDELGQPLTDREAVRVARAERHHEMIAERTVLPGVEDLLAEAAGLGVALAVASSSPSAWVEGHLERLGLRRWFAAVLTRDHVARAKPWPDLYLAACAAVAAAPARSVAIEDSPNGVAAAKAAGLACVAVPNDITRGLDFGAADLVVPSLAGVTVARLPQQPSSAGRAPEPDPAPEPASLPDPLPDLLPDPLPDLLPEPDPDPLPDPLPDLLPEPEPDPLPDLPPVPPPARGK